MSPELGVKLAEGGDDIELGKAYEITNVEAGETEVRQFHMIRVELVTRDGKVGSCALWKRPVTSAGSKLGSFIALLGSNTDKWLHTWIIFKEWKQGARIVELVRVPKATASKGVSDVIEPTDIPF